MMSFLLYWLALLPFMFVSPQKIRWLFLLKATIVPPAWIAILVWSLMKVPPRAGLFGEQSVMSGRTLSYAWLNALNSALGIYATLAVNIPDFTVRSFLSYCLYIRAHSYLLALRKDRTSVSVIYTYCTPL